MHDPRADDREHHGPVGSTRRRRGAAVGSLRGSILAAAFLLAACGSGAQPDDAAIVQDFQSHRSHVEVTADATVIQVLPERMGSSGPHQQFAIRLTSGDLTLLVEHNLSIGRRAPVSVGDHVIVRGEYIWTAEGGLIHFTHHDPEGRHEGGFIQDDGMTYD